jgi:hypothetical protein
MPVACRFCELSFPSYLMMVSHARYTHLVESIDITNTELEEVNIFIYLALRIRRGTRILFRFENPD